MKEDPVYRQNQRDSNQNWRENNPDYWKNYRKRHPKKAADNRLKQQIRNQKRKKETLFVTAASLKIDAKMDSVDWFDALQEKELWLVSSDAVISPIKLSLIIQNKPPSPSVSI